ncbi:MAG: YraN family protein [Acidimicrobiia bacterium]
MGHVPAGPVSQEGQGAHLSRRQRGRGGAPRARGADRRRLGALGERAAAVFLTRKGCQIVGRNVRSGRGEIDLIVNDRGVLVAVEVKTGHDPMLHFTQDKIAAVRAAMRLLRPSPRRLDLITVTPGPERVVVRWYRGAG